MPRPKRYRTIENPPIMEGFKPFGISMTDLEPVILLFEEYESMRLADYLGLTQEQAAEKMNVSRPTFTRIYEKNPTNHRSGFRRRESHLYRRWKLPHRRLLVQM